VEKMKEGKELVTSPLMEEKKVTMLILYRVQVAAPFDDVIVIVSHYMGLDSMFGPSSLPMK
jgi:hypothetical protein